MAHEYLQGDRLGSFSRQSACRQTKSLIQSGLKADSPIQEMAMPIRSGAIAGPPHQSSFWAMFLAANHCLAHCGPAHPEPAGVVWIVPWAHGSFVAYSNESSPELRQPTRQHRSVKQRQFDIAFRQPLSNPA